VPPDEARLRSNIARADGAVIAKAEWTQGEANPRFIVTSLKRTENSARQLDDD
jgi:hypothetical protein